MAPKALAMSAAAILKSAKKLISDKSRWCTGQYAKNSNLDPVPVWSGAAVRFCAYGAVSRCAGQAVGKSVYVNKLLHDAALREYGTDVITLNDGLLGHDAIMRVFDLAIEEAERHERG